MGDPAREGQAVEIASTLRAVRRPAAHRESPPEKRLAKRTRARPEQQKPESEGLAIARPEACLHKRRLKASVLTS